MNPPWAHTSLHDFKPPSFTQHYILSWDAHVLENEMRMAVRCIIVPIHREHALYFDPRRVSWDNDNRLLFVFVWVVWIRFAEHDVDFAAWIACTAYPPFLYTLTSALLLFIFMVKSSGVFTSPLSTYSPPSLLILN